MRCRTTAVKTSLYDLISVLHDEPEMDDAQISETVRYLAKAGKIRWVRQQPHGDGVVPPVKKARVETYALANEG